MNYGEFKKKIRENKIGSAYLFFGQEEYLMDMAIDELKKKYIEESFETINYVKIEGKNCDLQTLINACETLPFMSEKKIVLVNDISAFMDNIKDRFEKEFYDYIDRLGDFLCLIFMDNTSSIRKNSKIYKHLNKDNRVVDFSKLEGQDLNRWIERILKKHDKEMSLSNINYFIERSSYRSRNIDIRLFDLENELLKVVDHSKHRELSREDIDQVLVKSIDTNIFELLNAINRRDSESAIEIFDDMYMANEPVLRILYMITRQFRLILSYKLYKDKGYGDNKVQEKLQIKNYEFGKIRSQSSKFQIKELEDIMEYLLNIDIQTKTTTTDQKLLVEMLLIKLCNK